MGSEHYCLRWNNHQNNLLGVFSQLLQDESLVDVTLACSEGHSIRAHKVVLSACSSYFQSLFIDHPNRHPIVILKDVCFAELRTLVEFMYRGEVNVEYCQLSTLLKTAESLKVKGLAEMTHLSTSPSSEGQRDSMNGTLSEPPPQPSSSLPPPSSPLAKQTMSTDPVNPESISIKKLASEDSSPPPVDTHCGDRSPSPDADDVSSVQSGPSDMTLGSRLPSPHSSEPMPGPSGLPPVQQVPLSLKKEVDWDRGDDNRSTAGESSVEYRHSHDLDMAEGSSSRSHRRTPFDQLSSSSRSSTPFQYPPFAAFPGLSGFAHGEGPISIFALLQQQGLLASQRGSSDEGLIGGLIRCAICLAGFPSTWLLEQHTALQHTGQPVRGHGGDGGEEKPFRCDQCGQSYRYRSAYLKHREQNHRARLPADKLFTCDVCGMQFRYLKSFKKHRLNHALERLHSNPYQRSDSSGPCDYSMEGSSNRAAATPAGTTSESQVSSSNEAVARSSSVPPSSNHSEDAVDSLALALSGGEASLFNLLRLSSERQKERRAFACPFCGKCVRSKENLKLHVRKHTGERPFACLFCGRAFGGKSDLTRHLRIHTGERPYHCEMCGKCFARADYLSKHLTTHVHSTQHQR
nr:PREDICTED: zinc finger and BTB domain-containing protein 49-like [Bemisia tabaci]